MLTTDSCTLYLRRGNGFDRFFVPACHWQERQASNVIKSGMQSADSVVVYIPKSAMVLFPDGNLYPSDNLFPNADISPKSPAQDMIVKGKCLFTFDNSSPESASESLKAFRAAYDFHTVMSVDRLLYGSEEMQHFKLSAR